MAWFVKITSVSGQDGQTDLTLTGDLKVAVEYYDNQISTSTPQFAQSFVFPHNMSRTDMLAQIIARGKRIKAARDSVATMQADVNKVIAVT